MTIYSQLIQRTVRRMLVIQSGSTSGGGGGGGVNGSYIAVTTTYAILANDQTIDCTSGTRSIAFSTFTITLATTSSQTIGNISPTTTKTINPGEVYNVESDNANWKLFA